MTAMLVIAAALSLFAFAVDPWLQQIAPLEAWPITAKVMHWASPWVAMSTGFSAAALGFGVLDGVWVQYFIHRRTVIAMLVWALMVVGATAWSALALPVQLLLQA